MKVPTEDEVSKIIARLRPKHAYLAPTLAKQFVARVDHGFMPVLRAADCDPIEKAHKAATELLRQINRASPDTLESVLGCFLMQRNAEGLCSAPERFKGQLSAIVEALADTGREIRRRKLRPEANTDGIAVALAAWDAWDEGDEDGRRKKMPEGLRDKSPFIEFLGDMLGACEIPPQKAVTIYRAALVYLKNHR